MFQLVYCVGGSLKNLFHFGMGGGLANADVIRGGGGGGGSLNADRGEGGGGGGGVKFAKMLLTSYVNAPLVSFIIICTGNFPTSCCSKIGLMAYLW